MSERRRSTAVDRRRSRSRSRSRSRGQDRRHRSRSTSIPRDHGRRRSRSADRGNGRQQQEQQQERVRGRHDRDRDTRRDKNRGDDRGEQRRYQRDDTDRNPSPDQRPRHHGDAAPGPPPSARPPARAEQLHDQPPEVGSIHHGVVHTVKPFGIFVAIDGYRRQVLVHHTQVADDVRFEKSDDDETKVKALDFLFGKGTPVYLKVTEVAPDPRGELRVNGSMRVVSQQDGSDLDPTGRMGASGRAGGAGPQQDEPPEVGTVHRATVKKIEAYGVFVALDGYRKHGLVHSSQVSNYLSFNKEDNDAEKKAEMAGVVSVGDAVYVKVVEVTEDESGRGPKIGCSMKLVNQTSGEDMDPTGLRYKPRGEGGGPGGRHGNLGSGVGEVVGGKIDWGHLAGDKRMHVGDHKGEYSMLEGEQEPKRIGGALPPPPPLPPGGLPLPPPPAGPTNVAEALAILEKFSKKDKKKDKKDKKGKKPKKDKDKKEKKHGKEHKKSKKD